ncbi:MAG: YHS domain-containing (seleno)protein [Lacipirellulaceae bacterium]
MKTTQQTAMLALSLLLGLAANSAKAESRAYLNNNNIPSSGLALEGYCPVAYFAVNNPVMGKKEYSVDHKGVIYYLVNADAKAEFLKNPEKYVPAYGGWCAFGMAIGDKFPVDPTNFKIVDGKLHVFLRNKKVDALKLWNKGQEKEQVKKAAAHWKKVNK